MSSGTNDGDAVPTGGRGARDGAHLLRLALGPAEPGFRGELVQFGRVLRWR
jgi:hypothetical protein